MCLSSGRPLAVEIRRVESIDDVVDPPSLDDAMPYASRAMTPPRLRDAADLGGVEVSRFYPVHRPARLWHRPRRSDRQERIRPPARPILDARVRVPSWDDCSLLASLAIKRCETPSRKQGRRAALIASDCPQAEALRRSRHPRQPTARGPGVVADDTTLSWRGALSEKWS